MRRVRRVAKAKAVGGFRVRRMWRASLPTWDYGKPFTSKMIRFIIDSCNTRLFRLMV